MRALLPGVHGLPVIATDRIHNLRGETRYLVLIFIAPSLPFGLTKQLCPCREGAPPLPPTQGWGVGLVFSTTSVFEDDDRAVFGLWGGGASESSESMSDTVVGSE